MSALRNPKVVKCGNDILIYTSPKPWNHGARESRTMAPQAMVRVSRTIFFGIKFPGYLTTLHEGII